MSTKYIFIAWLTCLVTLPSFAQSDAYAMHRILQRYTEAYGGARDAEALSSVSIEGTIEQNGGSYEFIMRKKRPYSMRYQLSNAQNSVVVGFNGMKGWMRTESDGVVEIEDVDAQMVGALRQQARFESPLFRHLEKSENEITLIERTIFDGKNVFLIEVRESGGQWSRYYLDAKNAHVLRLDRLDSEGQVLNQTLYRDYKEVEGFPFAHEVECRVGEEMVSLAKVRKVEVNPGLLSFYFEKPRR